MMERKSTPAIIETFISREETAGEVTIRDTRNHKAEWEELIEENELRKAVDFGMRRGRLPGQQLSRISEQEDHWSS